MTSNLPLVVRGPYGFGRVTLIALDVDQKPFSDWPDRSLFWVRALDLRPQRPSTAAAGTPMGGGRAVLSVWASPTSSSQLRVALEQFPGVKLIPFGWVAFFIFLYILLIGPGDYFFLKKVLKRMELTWITFPTIVVTVSLLAYYAAYVLKGNDLLVNKVDVVDIDQAAGLVRGNTWIEPVQPAEPRLHDPGDPPAARPRAAARPSRHPRGEPVRPPAGNRGRDELVQRRPRTSSARWGARAGGSASAAAATPISPSAGVEWLENVRIPIWSTKCITARWFGPAAPLVDSDLQPVGTDRLAGTVTNRQTSRWKTRSWPSASRSTCWARSAPGATVRVELDQRPQPLGLPEGQVGATTCPTSPGTRDFRIDRADLMLGRDVPRQRVARDQRPVARQRLRCTTST